MRSHPSSETATLAGRKQELSKARDYLKVAGIIAKDISNCDAEVDLQSFLALNYSDVSKFKRAESCQEEVVMYREEKYTSADGGIHLEVINAELMFSKIYFAHGHDPRTRKKEFYLGKARSLQFELFNKMSKESHANDFDYQAQLCEVQAALARTYYAQRATQEVVDMGAKLMREGR